LLKAFKSIFLNNLARRTKRESKNKAVVYNCEVLMRKFLSSLQVYTIERSMKNKKRTVLANTLQKAD